MRSIYTRRALGWVTILGVLLSQSVSAQETRQSSALSGTATGQVMLRGLDDSDAEMKALLEEIRSSPTCEPGPICEPRKSLYRQGGDRLADYLIRQYEASVTEGYPGGAYLAKVTLTGSMRGVRYVVNEYRNPRDSQARIAALHALAAAADPDAIDIAMGLLEQKGNIERIDLLSLSILRQNMEDTRVSRSDASGLLQRLESRDSPKPWLRQSAYRALNSLEAKQVIPPRTPPADLLDALPTKPQ